MRFHQLSIIKLADGEMEYVNGRYKGEARVIFVRFGNSRFQYRSRDEFAGMLKLVHLILKLHDRVEYILVHHHIYKFLTVVGTFICVFVPTREEEFQII